MQDKLIASPLKNRSHQDLKQKYLSVNNLRDLGPVFVILIILLAIYWSYQPSALAVFPNADLAASIAPLALAAAGEAIVIINRGFDLSLAGVVSVVSAILASVPFGGVGWGIALIVVAVALGALVGLVNGLLVAYLEIQSIAATLAVMIVLTGIALIILNVPGGTVNEVLTDSLTGVIGNVGAALIVLIVVWMAWERVRRSALGIKIYAVGADERAAKLSGINIRHTRLAAYIFAGIFYGLAGVMLAAQTGTGSPTAGDPLLLLSFAAVVLGGVSLSGGRGSVIGAILGAAILVILIKVLFVLGVSSFYTTIIQGLVIVIVVGVNTYFNERKRR